MEQIYKMTNGTMTDAFAAISPEVQDMDSAIAYFETFFSVEFPGCNVVQIEGINTSQGPNFYANTVWATPTEVQAFEDTYGYVPAQWEVFTVEEQQRMMQAEWDKEQRKACYY